MPLSFRQAGNTFIQGPNISIYPSGNSYAISSSSPTTDSFGFTSVGIAGIDDFPPSPIYVLPIYFLQDLTGPDSTMVYKSFSAGTGIGIIDSNNTLIFTATTPTVNGLTSFTSAGTGNRLLLSTAITSNTLFYKSLSGTSNLSINDNDNGTLTFSLAGDTGTIISGVNIGTNANSLSFFTGLTTTTNPNDTLAFRNILAGPNIAISPSITNDGDILISRGSDILVNQISNIGGGARFLSSITSNSAITRTIANASGFSSALGAGIITIPTSSTDSDSTAFITAASITDARQIAAIENLVTDLKTANIWNKMLAIYPLVGGTANSHKYNLKDPRDLDAAYRLDFSVGWTHSANGMTPNGSTQANTFLAPSTIGTSHHISYYSRTQNAGNQVEIGAQPGGGALQVSIALYYSGLNMKNFVSGGYPAFSTNAVGSTNTLGFQVGSRITSTDSRLYFNGQQLGIQTASTTAFTTTSFRIGANSGQEFSTKECAFASIGSGLTASEVSAFTTAVENYQTTLNRQVVTLQNQTVRIAPTNTTASLLYISNATSQLGTSANFGADATTGSLGIGVAASTTSRLLIAAGTGAISQLRLTAFSASTSLIDGDIWYSTSGNTLKFYKNNISTDFIFKNNNISLTGLSNSILMADTAGTLSTKYINSFGLFNALSSVTIENTSSETSIISSVLTGSTTLLSSTNAYNPELGVGRKFRFNAKGSIDTGDFVTLNIIIKLGSTIISSSSTITIGGGGPYSSEIEIDTTFTIRNSGLVIGSGKILFLTSPPSTLEGDPVIFGLYSQDATIVTTSDKVFDCTAQFDTADPLNTITINESTLEILN